MDLEMMIENEFFFTPTIISNQHNFFQSFKKIASVGMLTSELLQCVIQFHEKSNKVL